MRQAIFAVDSVQRKRHHVYEYDLDPKCVLRVSIRPAKAERVLRDGTRVKCGDYIAEIHYHNENIGALGAPGPETGWGMRFYSRLRYSLRSLARHLSETPECQQVVAVSAETTYSGAEGSERYKEYFERLGFEFTLLPPPRGLAHISEFFLSLYVWGLIWAANPTSLRGRPLRTAEHAQLWMSRAEIMHNYGGRDKERACSADSERQERVNLPGSAQIPADAH